MNADAVPGLVWLVALVALLFIGRGQVAKGSNAQVANGVVLFTLAAIVGVYGLFAQIFAW